MLGEMVHEMVPNGQKSSHELQFEGFLTTIGAQGGANWCTRWLFDHNGCTMWGKMVQEMVPNGQISSHVPHFEGFFLPQMVQRVG